MLSIELKQKLKAVYQVEESFIDVLMLSGISADEFSEGELYEDMTEEKFKEYQDDIVRDEDDLVTTGVYGVVATTNYHERKFILEFVLPLYNSDQLHEIINLFEAKD